METAEIECVGLVEDEENVRECRQKQSFFLVLLGLFAFGVTCNITSSSSSIFSPLLFQSSLALCSRVHIKTRDNRGSRPTAHFDF